MIWDTVSIPFKVDRMTVCIFDAHSKESAEARCHSSGALPSMDVYNDLSSVRVLNPAI